MSSSSWGTPTEGDTEKLLAGVGATVGGYLGWYLGESAGIMTAFMLSMVGTGFGIYAGRRIARDYLP
jgi:hypothetical protein